MIPREARMSVPGTGRNINPVAAWRWPGSRLSSEETIAERLVRFYSPWQRAF